MNQQRARGTRRRRQGWRADPTHPRRRGWRHRPWVVGSVALAIVSASALAALAAGTGTVDPPPRMAMVTRSDIAADALAAGPIAGRAGAPMFTTPPTVLAEEARDGLVAYDPELVIIAGGEVAISPEVEQAIEDALGLPDDAVIRAAGPNRHATAVALAELIDEYNPGFLPVDATAADADLLDGMDASDFMAADANTAQPITVRYGPFTGGLEDNASTASLSRSDGRLVVLPSSEDSRSISFNLDRAPGWGGENAFDTLTDFRLCYSLVGVSVSSNDGITGLTFHGFNQSSGTSAKHEVTFDPPLQSDSPTCYDVPLPHTGSSDPTPGLEGLEWPGITTVEVATFGGSADVLSFYGFWAEFGPAPVLPS